MTRHISGSINSKFIAFVPKVSNPSSFPKFNPISLCNITYKLILKICAECIKGILSVHISGEKLGFLHNRLIHDAIAIAQECIHSIHTKKLEAVVMKVDLQKAYDYAD